eukprot:CAMPEP_0184328480 /NCGR_PEP_ID=MMETSP1049-20130417/143645_1 /TAXON_ID=77928 /ORGANISM="Proteomonas sulcata, Strain CCMP704" /LENGTH=123 /DNA_ID=CAMNT_0026650795 /DNA_START=1765 /DNA_END=2134 /DNA_ORIENTATION=-
MPIFCTPHRLLGRLRAREREEGPRTEATCLPVACSLPKASVTHRAGMETLLSQPKLTHTSFRSLSPTSLQPRQSWGGFNLSGAAEECCQKLRTAGAEIRRGLRGRGTESPTVSNGQPAEQQTI